MEMVVVRGRKRGSRGVGGGWSGGNREGWTGRMDGRAARGGCQAPNFPAQMEPNTVQRQPSSPQTVCMCVKDVCVGNFKVCELMCVCEFAYVNIGFFFSCEHLSVFLCVFECMCRIC